MHQHLSRRTRTKKEDKELLQAIFLFIVTAVFVGLVLILNI